MSDELTKLDQHLPNIGRTNQVPSPNTEAEAKCPECQGMGEYWTNKGTHRYCSCPEGQRKKEQSDARFRLTVWENMRLPNRLLNCSFDLSPVSEAIKGKLREPPEPHDDGYDDWWEQTWNPWHHSWLLWGAYGTGKTGLAISYARQMILDRDGGPKYDSALFRTMPDLLSELRDTYNRRPAIADDEEPISELAIIDRYQRVGLLILDDLGAEHVKDKGWLEDRLYQIIGRRHADDGLNDYTITCTIFTSNLSPDQLGKRIGERVMWRIVEMCGEDGIIEVKGKNLRDRD